MYWGPGIFAGVEVRPRLWTDTRTLDRISITEVEW